MPICEVGNTGSSPVIHHSFGGIGRRDGLKTYFHLEYWFDSNNEQLSGGGAIGSTLGSCPKDVGSNPALPISCKKLFYSF